MQRLISIIFIFGILVSTGCSKESNVVAPSGSLITVTATPGDTIAVGQFITVYASVTDSTGKPLNGVGVSFTSSSPAVASFSATSAVGQTSADTNASGVASAKVTALAIGTADVTADISGVSGSIALTVQ